MPKASPSGKGATSAVAHSPSSSSSSSSTASATVQTEVLADSTNTSNEEKQPGGGGEEATTLKNKGFVSPKARDSKPYKRLNPKDTHDLSKLDPELYETTVRVLEQRQKQLDFGKNTLGYDRYLQVTPRFAFSSPRLSPKPT